MFSLEFGFQQTGRVGEAVRLGEGTSVGRMSEQNSDPSRPFDPPAPPTAPPAPPQAPPAPPAAPEPERPEVPKYGEYAENTYGVPGYPASQSAPPAAPPAPAAPGMPAYGVPGYGAPGYGAPAYAAPVRKRRTWDLVLTIILLVLAVFGVLIGLVYAGIFASPDLLDQAMQQQGYGGFSGDPGAAPAVLAISHIVLFLAAVGLSIPLLIRGRIVVFWIPLTAGVIAAIIFWVTVFAVILSDPGFISKYGG
jgi:hypothetical protein